MKSEKGIIEIFVIGIVVILFIILCSVIWITIKEEKDYGIKEGQVIGFVGPKYVYGVPGNRYFDSSGKPTNGATTGCHLHLGFRIDGEYKNPLDFF